MRFLPLVLLLAACNPGQVRVTGHVDASPEDKAPPLAGGTVTILDEGGERFDEATTDDNGWFRADAPKGQTIYALVSAPDYEVASFTGVSGLDERLQVSKGLLFGVSAADRAGWQDRFAGCEGMGSEGLVIGRTMLFLPEVPEQERPVVSGARVRVESQSVPGEEGVRTACYLDDRGGAYDPEAEFTGDSGWFAVPDVGEGPHSLVIEIPLNDDLVSADFRQVWMPPGGVVARFPLWVELPNPG